MEMKVLNDFSYAASRAAGDGWMLVGDAFCFLDPIYSSGVRLALSSAELAADTALDAFAAGDFSAVRLARHEPRLRAGIHAFRKLVYAFYNPRFSFGAFLRRHPEHRGDVVRILVGDVFDHDYGPFFRDLDDFTEEPPASRPGSPGKESRALTAAGQTT
jgi:flavin-dependent dehydrogenase